MTPRTSAVRLRGLTKRFKSGAVGVHDASIDVLTGEFVTFLGPSGSGKTTTLNMIAGFTRPTSGSIEINDSDVTRMPPNRRNLGYVFQNYALFPHMSVRDNVAFGLHGRGLSKDEMRARIDAALEMVRLRGFEARTPKQISGGQQQRVALARALVYRPPVLLMDEPLSALDKALRDQMQVEIGRIHQEVGTTFLFVTHDQDEALGLSDRVVLFNEGRIEQVGTPSELYESPTTLFAARFLGESNVFAGTMTGQGEVRFADTTVRFQGRVASTSVAVVVRPEHLTVVEAGAVTPNADRNVVHATVTDVSYFGSFRRILLRYEDGTVGRIRESASERPLTTGARVALAWPVDRGVAVPGEESL